VQTADAYTRTFAISNMHIYESGTDSYNCHSYAWNNMQHWVANSSNMLSKYWTDYSYITYDLANKPYIADLKVFYGNDDHTAVTTSDATIFISKMGCGCRVGHLWNNSPYVGGNLTYYAPLYISGPDVVPCSGTVSYTIPGSPTSIAWSASNLDIVSAQNNTNTYSVKKSSNSGQSGMVSVTCTYNGVIRYLYKSVDIGIPRVKKIDAYPSASVSSGTTIYFTAFPAITSSQGTYEWTVSPSNGVYISPYGQYCNITFGSSGYYTVGARTYSNTSNGHSCTITPTTYTNIFISVN
jgi:hypothetical protein